MTPRYTSDLPDEFFSDLRRYAAELGFDPRWMLDVMFSESGIRPTAAYRHPPNLATGLIGFVDINRYGIPGIEDNSLASHDAFARLPATTQLRAARDFWRPMAHRATSAANLYQYAFLPASLSRGTSPDTVLAAEGGAGYGGREGEFYRINAGYLDVDKNGEITVSDLARRLEMSKRGQPRYDEALERLGSVPDAPARSRLGTLLVLGGLGVAGYYAATRTTLGQRTVRRIDVATHRLVGQIARSARRLA